ncbi:MAG: beta-propeller fold lactonase family protein [Thermoguttaceae bacterium]|jgi:YVTN family beta-propeller protein
MSINIMRRFAGFVWIASLVRSLILKIGKSISVATIVLISLREMQFITRSVTTTIVLPILIAAAVPCSAAAPTRGGESPSADAASRETVGRHGAERSVLPVTQTLTPLGRQIELPRMRPQALALSPDGRLLAVSGKTNELVILDPASGQIRQRVGLPAGKLGEAPRPVSPQLLEKESKGQLSYTGLIFAPDGRRIYLSNVEGDLKVFQVDDEGQVTALGGVALPPADAPRRAAEIPAGLAVSPDGRRLFVCGNLSNRLLELEAASGRVVRHFDVGVAPYDVVLAGSKAYVSNWGGRRPRQGDLVGPAGRGTHVRVDPLRHIACEGSVSVIDLASGAVGEIVTHLHASALALSPDGKYVVCANAGSDNLSVIDTAGDRVVETICAKPSPSELLGATPNALAFAPDGRTLYVANGTQNAVAVIALDPANRRSKLLGLIPVGWFPGAMAWDARRRQLCVANIKGLPPEPSKIREGQLSGQKGYNSHMYYGSLSLLPLPAAERLPQLSQAVWDNLRRGAIEESLLPPRPGQPPRAMPERIGEPSLIKHVLYVIKENRTYDQVLGDVRPGNGDPALCVFGRSITPNQHKLVGEFVLLDNTYCAGILSADGHQWCTTGIATDYMEKSFADFPRSYPNGMGRDESDALAYSPAGFIWDRALAQHVSLRNYGEFMGPAVRWRDERRKGAPDFTACYQAWQGRRDDVIFECRPSVATLAGFSPTHYVGWDLAVPDQFRADFILRELRDFTARGQFPALVIICLPNDHTEGTKPGCPTPAAMVADNDLALGRIIGALSRSPFWKEMAVFAIEDDPQNGWDHVSGYRTTAYLASPYARRGTVVSTQYNTVSILRSIEQILGLKPLNQFDAAARTMRDCFRDQPDFSPFDPLPSQVPLDQMNGAAHAMENAQQRADALASERMNFTQPDRAPEDALNRILWRAMRGPQEPYPAWAVAAEEEDSR